MTARVAEEERVASALARDAAAADAARIRAPADASARVQEMENRLRELESQLAGKRAKRATTEGEKLRLEKKLADALVERRRLQNRGGGGGGGGGGGRGGAHGIGAGLKRRGGGGNSGGDGVGFYGKDTPGRVFGGGLRARVKNVAGRVDVLGRRAGRHLRHSGGWRSAVILYVLSLHSLAFLVLAWRALGSHRSIERGRLPPGVADPAWND